MSSNRKEKKLKKRGFHRLLYDELIELERDNMVHNLTCGYMRKFYYNKNSKRLFGLCSNTGNYCERKVPFNGKDCQTYRQVGRI